MVDENKITHAKQVYKTLCDAIDNRQWNYDKDEENLRVQFEIIGEDLPMRFIVIVDAERELITLASPMQYKISESKRMEGAIAACAASFGLTDGHFVYNISNGVIMFKMTSLFRNSVIGEALFQYMIDLSCIIVDKYNDRFLALDKGIISVADFIDKK